MIWMTPLLIGLAAILVLASVCAVPLYASQTKIAIAGQAVSRGLAAAVCASALMLVIPRYKKVFEGFGVKLNSGTHFLFNLSDFSIQYSYCVLPLLAGLCVADVLIFRRLMLKEESRSTARYWSVAGCVLIHLAIIYCILAVVIPMQRIVSSLI